jgi:hypothetical protein
MQELSNWNGFNASVESTSEYCCLVAGFSFANAAEAAVSDILLSFLFDDDYTERSLRGLSKGI